MKLLLDTCCFLWMIDQVECLSPKAIEALENNTNELVLHQASSWEIQLKYDRGKLPLSRPPSEIIPEAISVHGIRYQTIQDSDIWHLQKLPDHHRDPFDRLLISHALYEGFKIVTPDPEIHKYPVPVIW